jgi:hypothetical protein
MTGDVEIDGDLLVTGTHWAGGMIVSSDFDVNNPYASSFMINGNANTEAGHPNIWGAIIAGGTINGGTINGGTINGGIIDGGKIINRELAVASGVATTSISFGGGASVRYATVAVNTGLSGTGPVPGTEMYTADVRVIHDIINYSPSGYSPDSSWGTYRINSVEIIPSTTLTSIGPNTHSYEWSMAIRIHLSFTDNTLYYDSSTGNMVSHINSLTGIKLAWSIKKIT